MYQRLVLLFLCLCMTSMLMAQQAFDIHVDFDECISNFGGDNMDYSEFQTSGQTCTSLSISENGIYRRNPEVNKHSCTPGVGNTPGMCVEADQTCEYLADSDRAIRFEVIVDASAQNPAGIRKIEFYQKSPVFYNWINGAAGINNIPKRYSVRVTVGGNEIYRMQDLYTTASWAKRSFDFSQVAEFVVTENTTFSFELTAYCPINNGSEISVWDIDELSIYDLNSNEGIDGGTLTGGPFAFDSVGDGTPDMLEAGSITLANAQGANSQWIITDDEGYILGLPPMPGVVDFDGAGAGTCLIWHLSYDGEVTGLAMGLNANDLAGCFSLSNNIEVVRSVAGDCQANGGQLIGGPFAFDSVGDGTPDMLEAGSITLANAQGANSQWIITDAQGYILGLPPMPGVVNFDGAGAGTCLIWHLSYDGEVTGLAMGLNANDLAGCFSLSNNIEVVRSVAGDCQANGGELIGGPFAFDSVGDGTPDMLEAGSITLANAQGMNSQWVVTDDQGNILGLPPMPSVVDFDGAGEGVCLIWHLSYDGKITGAEVGMNANDITGCWSLSNSIEVVRTEAIVCEVAGGTLTGGPFALDSVGDGTPDMLEAGSITLANAQGMNSQWVVTDDQGNILGLPPMPSVVDFDSAGEGVCLIWHLSYDGEITGAEVGMNANDITGCWSLSNSIVVTRTEAIVCEVSGGTLTGGPFAFDSVGDGAPDMLEAGAITLANAQGMNSQWVVTDDQGNILGLPPMPSVVDFDGAGAGVCLIWHLSYDGEITGAEVGMNANDITGCWSLSNSIEVTRTEAIVCEVAGGTLAGGPFAFCVGDGEADIIAVDGITLEGNIGTNSQWVITDDQGTILGLPPTFSEVDFDGAPVGTCLVWHLSFEDGLIGAEVELNANDLQGCFSLSNPITVTRDAEGGACGDGAVDDGPAQVVINEIIEGSGVELKNIGSESIDISSYWLCDFPAYDRLDDLVINCGSLLLEPGESITVITDDISVDGDDGEMGLYTSNSFSSSAAIIDYVEWGESGHGRSAVAVGANVWSAGDFVASFASGKSLSYDGEGDAPSDWSETDTTPCEDNGFTERPISDFVKLETLQNPVLDQLVMRITSESPLRKATVDIRNIMGEIVKTMEIDISQNQKLHAVDIADVAAGIYYISIRENYGIVQSTIVKQ